MALSLDTGFEATLARHTEMVAHLEALAPTLETLEARAVETLRAGGTFFWLGNGGSAADAEHMAAELMVRYRKNRPPIRAVALTASGVAMSAHSNDFGFEGVFARQIEALATANDMVMLLSTSGESANCVQAAQMCAEKSVFSVGLLGGDGGALANMVSLPIIVASDETARVQEGHSIIGHWLCARLEERLEETLATAPA